MTPLRLFALDEEHTIKNVRLGSQDLTIWAQTISSSFASARWQSGEQP